MNHSQNYEIQPQKINLFDGKYELVKPLLAEYGAKELGPFTYFQMKNRFNGKSYGKWRADVHSAAKEMISSFAEQLHGILSSERQGIALPPQVQNTKQELSDFIQPIQPAGLRVVK